MERRVVLAQRHLRQNALPIVLPPPRGLEASAFLHQGDQRIPQHPLRTISTATVFALGVNTRLVIGS